MQIINDKLGDNEMSELNKNEIEQISGGHDPKICEVIVEDGKIKRVIECHEIKHEHPEIL